MSWYILYREGVYFTVNIFVNETEYYSQLHVHYLTDLPALLTFVSRQTSALVLLPDDVHMSKVRLLLTRYSVDRCNHTITESRD